MNNLLKLSYLLKVCCLTFVPNTSDSAIVYISGEEFVLGDTHGEAVYFEFGEVSAELIFNVWESHPGGVNEMWWNWGGFGPRAQGVQGPGTSSARLEVGMEIGEGLVWGEAGRAVGQLANTAGDGPFYDASGFIGVRVFEDIAGWDLPYAFPYYGWIRVEHNASESTLTVHDWAWNSVQGEPILAGAIPEPRVYALAFGVGVFGFVLVRRWRGKRNLE